MTGTGDLWGFPAAAPSPTREVWFFAIRPDSPARARILAEADRLSREHGCTGYRVSPERFHVTLCTVLSAHRLRESPERALARAGAAVRSAPVEVCLDAFAGFPGRRSHPLVLLGDATTGERLGRLHSQLVEALAGNGIRADRSHAFRPHLTLFYDDRVCPAQAPVPPICWQATEFVLLRSVQGQGRHDLMGSWPLAPPASSPD